MITLTIYTKPLCPQCDATKKVLDKLGIPYRTEALTDEIRDAAAARNIASAPIVHMSVDGTESWWGGFRPDRLTALAGAA